MEGIAFRLATMDVLHVQPAGMGHSKATTLTIMAAPTVHSLHAMAKTTAVEAAKGETAAGN